MSNGLIAFMLAAGAGTWIFTKLQRQTGGNTKSSAIAATVLGVITFFIVFAFFSKINPN